MAKAFPNTGVTIIDSSSDLTGFSPSEGLMVFQKDTNELKIYDGSSWVSVIDTDTTPGLVKIIPTSVSGTGVSVDAAGKISFTNSPSIQVNGVFSSLYRNYHIIFSMNSTGTSAITARMKLTISGSTASGNYYCSIRAFNSATGDTSFSDGGTDTTQVLLGWPGEPGYIPLSGFVNISALNTTNHKAFYGVSSGLASSVRYLTSVFGGTLQTNATNIDGFYLYPGANNLTGELTVYGYRNS